MKKILLFLVLTFGLGFSLGSCDILDNVDDIGLGDRDGRGGGGDDDRDGRGGGDKDSTDRDGRGGGDRDGHGTPCFKLVYPVIYIMPDGAYISGTEREMLNMALRAWHKENPDSEEKGKLMYPVEVTLEDGSTASIGSEEEMERLKKSCAPDKKRDGKKRRRGHGDRDGDDDGEGDDDDDDLRKRDGGRN